jgi:hypothetical protein
MQKAVHCWKGSDIFCGFKTADAKPWLPENPNFSGDLPVPPRSRNALKFRFQKNKSPARPQSSHKIKDFLRTDEKGIDSLPCAWYIKHVNMNSCSCFQ